MQPCAIQGSQSRVNSFPRRSNGPCAAPYTFNRSIKRKRHHAKPHARRRTPVSAHKIVETRQYTEVVYYDDNGDEVARDHQNDDHLYDDAPPVELTEEEREDWL